MSKKSYRKYAATTMAVAVAASAVAPVVAGAEESDFSDVSEKSPHYEAIKAMAEAGIIQGDLVTGKFNPYDNVYRVQVAKMLQRALDLEVPANADEIIRDYTDITKNYTKEDRDAIAAVTAAKIFQGDTKTGKFNAWTPINREQMASVIVRAYQLHNVDADHVDVNLSNVDTSHKASVQILANLGLTTELSDYRPADPTNREQFASFLHRTIEKVGEPAAPVSDIEVKNVLAINKTGVTINIQELAEDLKDANIVVRNSAGQIVPTEAKDLNAGTTETTFHFVDALTYNPGGDWTVNGVAYDAGDFAIAGVESLTSSGKYIEVIFNQPIESLHQSEVTIRDTVNQTRAGIEAVSLSKDGMSAQITMLGDEKELEKILKPNREYTLSITKDGKVSSSIFEIPDSIEESNIVGYNLKNRTIDIVGENRSETLEVPKEMSFDFEALLGREATVWFNSDEEVTRYVLTDETVEYDSVEWKSNDNEFKLVTADEKYELGRDYHIRVNGKQVGKSDLVEEYDYAKVVLDKRNEVKFIDLYNWNAEYIVVEKVEDSVAIGYEGTEEVDLEDYVIVKDGETLKIEDIEQGDILFYNTEAANGKNEKGYAEVFNGTVTGKIDNVFRDEIEVNGELYDYMDGDTKLVKYRDGKKIKEVDSDEMKAFQKGGDVTLYLDRKGDLIYITGDQAEIAKTKLASHLIEDAIYYNNNHLDRGVIELEYVNEKGEESLDIVNLREVKKITVLKDDGTKEKEVEVDKPLTNGGKDVDIFRFAGNDNPQIVAKLKGDSTSDNFTGKEVVDLDEYATDNAFIEVTKDDDGNVIELTFRKSIKFSETGTDALELDDKFVKNKRLQSNTIVFDGSAGWADSSDYDLDNYNPKADEIEITTWGELSDQGYKVEVADVYADDKGYVDYLVIKKTDAADTSDVNGLVTSVNRNTDDELVRLTAFVDGKEQTFTFTKKIELDFEEGDVVRLTVLDADSSKVSGIDIVTDSDYRAKHNATVDETNFGRDRIKVDGVEYDVKNASFYNAVDKDDIKKISRSEIKKGYEVTVILEDKGSVFADQIILTKKGESDGGTTPPPVTGDAVTYIINSYADTFNTPRLVLEDINGDELTKNTDSFDALLFTFEGEEEIVNATVMNAWLKANGAGEYVLIEDNKLFVENETAYNTAKAAAAKAAADADITAAKAALAVPTIAADGLSLGTLPVTGTNGTTIAWASDSEAVVSNTGAYVADGTEVLTATITKGTGDAQTKAFTVTATDGKITEIAAN